MTKVLDKNIENLHDSGIGKCFLGQKKKEA